MSDPISRDQIARLEARVGADPGASEYPVLAEALRAAGRAKDAEEVARRGLARDPRRLDGGVALALALLDQGRVEDARRELAARVAARLAVRGAETPAGRADEGFEVGLSDGELDRAFDAAETDPDEVLDADRVALEAMRDANLDLPEETSEVASDPIFATSTMAELLERQGDASGASRIRASLGVEPPPAPGATRGAGDRRERIIATLESWLDNLRRQPQ